MSSVPDWRSSNPPRCRRRVAAVGKTDPGDAAVLAHVLRTDRHMHRPLPAISEQGRAVKTLARQHQEAVWALNQTVSRLRSLLLEFYPQAVQAFPNLKHRAATTVLATVPTPAAAAKLTGRRVVTLLQRSGRGNHPALAEQILSLLRAPALRQPLQVEAAYGHTVTGLIAVLVAMRQAADALEAQLGQQFEAHPQARYSAVGTRPGPRPGRPSPRRNRRRPRTIHRLEQSSLVRRHRAGDDVIGPIALRQGPQGP